MSHSESVPEIHPIENHRIPPIPEGSLRELVRNPLIYFTSISRQYGDIVCYRPAPDTAYLINHPDFVHHVLVDNHHNYTKDTFSNQAFKKAIGPGLINFEGETWLRQRRLMQPAFHQNQLTKMDGIIVHAAINMLNRWQVCYDNAQPIDLAREMAALTMTITCQALFGIDLGDEVYAIGEIINGVATLLEKPSHPRLQEAIRSLSTVVEWIIQQRRNISNDQGDLLGLMMTTPLDNTGQVLDDQQLRNEVMGLLIAGYETTANALTWTLYLLSQNLWASERMRKEIHLVLGERLPAIDDLSHLSYLRLVWYESLRLYPPAWIMGRRAISDDNIGGYHVPAGTVIAICLYTLHRHPAFWDQPDLFDPERFTYERSANRKRYCYIPFSTGPRQCLGAPFAQLEASLILACIAQRFELHLLPGIDVQPQALFVLRPNRDLLMTLHR